MMSTETDMYKTISFEETELRLGLGLGLSGGGTCEADRLAKNNNGKRGFSETESNHANVHLKLNLSTTTICTTSNVVKESKMEQTHGGVDQKLKDKIVASSPTSTSADPAKPPAK